jgi:hypothetical protein
MPGRLMISISIMFASLVARGRDVANANAPRTLADAHRRYVVLLNAPAHGTRRAAEDSCRDVYSNYALYGISCSFPIHVHPQTE